MAVPGPAVPTLIQGKIKTSLVIDQGDESEVTMPDQELITKWETTYKKAKGALPLPEREVTIEQCAVMFAKVESGAAPYADFGIFGPWGRKSAKARSLCRARLFNSC